MLRHLFLHLVLNAGEGKLQAVHTHPKALLFVALGGQLVQRFSGGKVQVEILPRSVDELTGGDVGGAADAGGADVAVFGHHQQQLGGAAGQVPGQHGLV